MKTLRPKKLAIAFVALSALSTTACVHQNAPGVGLVKFDSSAVFGITPEDKAPVPDFQVPLGTDFALPDVPFVHRDLNKVDDGPCPAAKLTAFPKTSATVRVIGQPPEGVFKWKRDLVQAKDATVNPPKISSLPFVLEGRAIRRVTKQSDHQFTFEMLAPDSFVPGNTIITGFQVNTNPQLIAERNVAARTIGVVNIPGTSVQRQLKPVSQLGDKFCVSLSLGSAQFVIEVNYRQDDAEFLTQLEHDAQQRNRVSPARDSQSQAVASAEQLFATYIVENALRQSAHGKHSTSGYWIRALRLVFRIIPSCGSHPQTESQLRGMCKFQHP